MPFVNAIISPAEYKEFELDQIDSHYTPVSNVSSQWTIDRAKEVHMRVVSRTVPPDLSPQEPFQLLWWKTDYVVFGCTHLQYAAKANSWRSHQLLTRLEIPASLMNHRDEIIEDIRLALTAYGTGGVYCVADNFKLTLELSEALCLE